MEPRKLTVDIAVGNLDVLVWGPEDSSATTVLALHGFPETAWEWQEVAEALGREGIRVVAPLQRGYSAGARPDEVELYDIEHVAADALAVLDHLGLREAHILGHDWGASVAWWLAGLHPDRTTTLTAVSVPHLAAFSHAVLTDPDQQARSAYFDLLRQPGKAEDVLLEDGGRRLRAMFDGEVPAGQVDRHMAVIGERPGLTGALNWYRAMRRYALPGRRPHHVHLGRRRPGDRAQRGRGHGVADDRRVPVRPADRGRPLVAGAGARAGGAGGSGPHRLTAAGLRRRGARA